MSHDPPTWTTAALVDLARALEDPLRRARAEQWLATWRTTTEAAPVLLTITPDGGAFRVGDGEWCALGRQRVLRRLLVTLARARGPVTARDLLAAGWPGERMLPGSARNRLHVALCRLRRAGLGDLLEFDGRAWRLGSGVQVTEGVPSTSRAPAGRGVPVST